MIYLIGSSELVLMPLDQDHVRSNSNRSQHIQSNAFERSVRITPQGYLSSRKIFIFFCHS